ncbi:hypothetical protein PLESTB_001004900 [Pleodorina starrii]|uniref:Uncharacterized protein n=1 Tax=Pleodorina starrii TaxID=330485 RepID=A0A9W6BQA1_9CHLO|nr:hypothetical protein PLESTB_001004900 [Pleodorina starrii]
MSVNDNLLPCNIALQRPDRRVRHNFFPFNISRLTSAAGSPVFPALLFSAAIGHTPSFRGPFKRKCG